MEPTIRVAVQRSWTSASRALLDRERTTCRGQGPLPRSSLLGRTSGFFETGEVGWSRRSELNGRPAHYEIATRVSEISDLARSNRQAAAGSGK